MKFQTGDHVLWKGDCWVVGLIERDAVEIEKHYTRGVISTWVLPKLLASHQRPWSFDKKLDSWIPA